MTGERMTGEGRASRERPACELPARKRDSQTTGSFSHAANCPSSLSLPPNPLTYTPPSCISVIVFSIQFTIATTVIFLLAAVSYQTLYYLLIPTHIYTTTVPIIYSSTSAIGVRDFTTLLSWKVPEYFNEEYYCDTAVPADSTLALNVLDLDQLLPDPHRFQGPSSKTCMNKEGKMEEKNKVRLSDVNAPYAAEIEARRIARSEPTHASE